MTLFEFAAVINQNLEIIFVPGRQPPFYAHFQSGEVKEGNILHGVIGNGESPNEALVDYSKRIAGQLLIFHAMQKDYRQEFTAPKSFTNQEYQPHD